MSLSAVLVCSLSLAAVPSQEASRLFVERRIAKADPAAALCRFADYAANGRAGRFVANTNFWLKGVDFSCASPWNGSAGQLRAGTAISRRHILFAKHFPLWKGTRILFTDGEIGVCPCRLADAVEVPKTDIMVGLLDAELTPNITPAKVLPAGFEKWLPYGSKWPVVTFNQNEEAFLSELICWSNQNMKATALTNMSSKNPEWRRFGGKIVVGDSGNPAFLLIGSQPILLYCLHTGGVGHGPMIHTYRAQIQKAMDTLCPGYSLDEYHP